jgi:CubicO group peptidase (beta-lactamase class C family)
MLKIFATSNRVHAPQERAMAKLLRSLLVAAALLLSHTAAAQTDYPGTSWTTKTPAQVGMSAAKLTEFRAQLPSTSQGVVIKDESLVFEWGTRRHGEWASASKPFYGTALLFAIQEHKAGGMDDLLTTHGWTLTPKDDVMTLRHLSNMVSGYTLPEEPGTRWAYNDYGIQLYVLTIFDVILNVNSASSAAVSSFYHSASRLGPLQFQDGALVMIKKGGPRVNMTPRDYARVGWFWLNKGNWRGTQILPQSYFDEVLRPQVPADLPRTAGGSTDDYLHLGSAGGPNNQDITLQGHYGFNLTFNQGLSGAKLWPDVPNDAFHASGHSGVHRLLMIPSLKLVMAWNHGPSMPRAEEHRSTNDIYRVLVQAVN